MPTITIATSLGLRTVDAAWARGGLAVHRPQDDANALFDNGWHITHAASGLALFKGIRRKADALKAARRLLTAGDWSRDYRGTKEDRALKDAARAVSLWLAEGDLARETPGVVVCRR